MSNANAYVIEIEDETVGLVVRQFDEPTKRRRYRFYASTPRFRDIEGVLFRSPAKAQQAAQALYRERPRGSARRRNGVAPRAASPLVDAETSAAREFA